MRKDIENFILRKAHDKELLQIESKEKSFADCIIAENDGYKPTCWREYFDAEEIVDNADFTPTEEQIEELKNYLYDNFGDGYPDYCHDGKEIVKSNVNLYRHALKILRDYNYRLCGFDDEVSFIKDEDCGEAKLIWFYCEREISCAVVYDDGTVFTLDDWQGAHPDAAADIPKFEWCDAKTDAPAIILNGLPRKF